MAEPLLNYVNGEWKLSTSVHTLDVVNPATQEVIAHVPLSTAEELAEAAQAAHNAFGTWRRTPPEERVQYLFKLKPLLEGAREELARLITLECGKTLEESRGEIQRAIENIEVACGIPTLMQGVFSEDIASGIDEIMIRQPVGVCAAICPFNFPAMIPFWFFPYALACGNTYIIKPSERVPMTMQRIFHLIDQLHLPAGVINLVNGDKTVVDAILEHEFIRAVSFVGSTKVARYVYSCAAANGKRAQCQGGAKNPIIVLPDADIEMATRISADSAFGCAGQRCLAASLAVTVGGAGKPFADSIAAAAEKRAVGFGLSDGVQMGPVITPESRARIEQSIALGVEEGATLLVDGRKPLIRGYEQGNFVRPPFSPIYRPPARSFLRKFSARCLG